jgi:glycosyltransferase involved in cell wall biosynthesis
VYGDRDKLKSNCSLIIDCKFLFGPTNGIRRDFILLNQIWASNFKNVSLLSHRNIDTSNLFARFPVWKVIRGKSEILARIIFKKKISIPPEGLLFFAQPNIFHTVFTGRKLFRIHDLFPISNPKWFNFISRVQFRYAIAKLHPDDIFLCNSRETYQSFAQYLPRFVKNAYIVDCFTDRNYSEPCQECESCRQDIPSNSYVLMVGTVEPRKNYQAALAAWNFDKKNNFYESLIIVGKPGWKSRKTLNLLRHGINNGIIYLPDVCDGALDKLYKNASLFLSTSFDEGFNIPLAEAAKFKLDVALSDISVHRSHAPANSIFFDPFDFETISKIFRKNFFVKLSSNSDAPFFENSSMPQLEEVLLKISELYPPIFKS